MATAIQPTLEAPQPLDTMGIEMSELLNEFKLSNEYVRIYTRDFVDLDNLVDAVPIVKDQDAPFVGDTTLAGLVRSIPRESLKKLPVLSVKVNGTKNSITALLCSYILKQRAFNEDTFGKGLLSTLRIGTEQALAHGYAPFLVATGQMYNDFGTTMRLIHYSDTSPEPGISDSNESGYHYVVANLTRSRVKKILKNALNNPDTAWNIPALQQVLETDPKAKTYSIYQSAAQKNQAGEEAGPTYEFVTRYETGPQPTIVTFCPQVEEAPLRVIESKSKFGYPRVMYLVIDPAALTPFGVSRVRLASPNQNMSNIYYGNVAAMLLLNSKPPIFTRGHFIKKPELKQGARWEALDPSAQAELKSLDNGTLNQFQNISQYFAGQIQNIMGGQTMTINAGSKASAFSKTAPGVAQSQSFMDVNTNQITTILENFLRQYGLSALDVIFTEQTGTERIIVDDETKNAINQLGQAQFVPQVDPMTGQATPYVPLIGDDNQIEVNWEELYFGEVDPNDPTGQTRIGGIKEWSVEVEVSLSADDIKDKKRQDMQDMLTVFAQNAQDLGPDAVQTVRVLTNKLLQDVDPSIKSLDITAPAPAPAMGPMDQMQPGDANQPPQQ